MTDIQAQFPHQTLTPVTATQDRPDYASLTLLRSECYANALAIPSDRGRGTDGHLEIVTTGPTYLRITGVPRTLPPHPGATPAPPPRIATRNEPWTAAEMAEQARLFKEAQLAFRTYHTVENLLKAQVLAAIPKTFTFELFDTELGYANVSTIAIITHVFTNYGKITTDDLAANMVNLGRQWSPAQPLEDLWVQIQQCKAFAATQDPITDKTIVRVTIANLEKSGVFSQALYDWRKRPDAKQTITNMKLDFNRTDKERQRALDSNGAGYAGKAQGMPNKENQTPTHGDSGPTKTPMDLQYCWTHGLITSTRTIHTSRTCRNPVEGHNCNATLLNMLGGNNTIRRKPQQPAIFKAPQHKPS